MKQYNQIGKYTKKEEVLSAKRNKTYVTPKGYSYVFDYTKQGNKYIFIINYKGYKMQVKESVFNTTNIDVLIESMIKEIENGIS